MAAPTYGRNSFYMPYVKPKPPPRTWTAADVEASIAANPNAGLANLPDSTFADTWGLPGGGAAPPGLPGSIKLPGYDPDFKALISGDPNVIAGEGDLSFYTGQVNDARRAAIRRAVIQAGLVPGTVGEVDEATAEAARQNKFSTAADLGRARDRGIADTGANLAARGILSSGALQGGNQRVQEGYERGTTQLTQALLDAIMGYESQAAEKLFAARTQYNSLREQAASRIAGDPRYTPLGETDAVLDPASGLYMTSDGRWYDRNRNRVSAPTASAPAASTPAPPSAVPPPLPVVTDFSVSRPRANATPGVVRMV